MTDPTHHDTLALIIRLMASAGSDHEREAYSWLARTRRMPLYDLPKTSWWISERHSSCWPPHKIVSCRPGCEFALLPRAVFLRTAEAAFAKQRSPWRSRSSHYRFTQLLFDRLGGFEDALRSVAEAWWRRPCPARAEALAWEPPARPA